METGGAIGVAGDVATSAVALAGLVLVFLGATSTSFDTYEATEKRAVLGRYRRRAWFAFVGFILSLSAAVLGILAKWLHIECAAIDAIFLLGFGLLWILVVAIVAILDIR